MAYVPLHTHSHFSLLDGLSQGRQMAQRVRSMGVSACALTDHGTLAGVVDFQKALSAACKHCGYQPNQHADGGKGRCLVRESVCPGYEPDPIKSILGCEFYLSAKDATLLEANNKKLSHLVVLATNQDGWKNLIAASSASNRPEHFYYKPRLDLKKLASFSTGNWVVFSGHPGSDLANVCFTDPKKAYAARTYEEAKGLAKPWPELAKDVLALAGLYQDLFGKGNFYLEVQLIDHKNLPAATIVAKVMRWVAKKTGIPLVATPDAHYPSELDAFDQRVLLCSALDRTMAEMSGPALDRGDEPLSGFFRSSRYHIPSPQEMAELHDPGELEATLEIAQRCQVVKLTAPPAMPVFECPDGLSADEYLARRVEQGWMKKVEHAIPCSRHMEYRQRLNMEMEVLRNAGLSAYFLIVDDYCTHARDVMKCKSSKGRGSGAGSLVLHLLGVTNCDPIEYDLLFERFYNAGRNSPGRVSLPDVDCDFPVSRRDEVYSYIIQKYGESRVCQMATYTRLQGREVLTTVLRVRGWGTHDERKQITALLPDESEISDKLQEMREEFGEASIIEWALENNSEALSPYCHYDDDGQLQGPLATYFEQAIRLEGTKKAQSRHPSGVLISPEPLGEIYPMLYDKSTKREIVSYEMNAVEAAGGVKFDILGVAAQDKVRATTNCLRTGVVGVV